VTDAQRLRSRRFVPLFLTQFLGAFNDNVFKNALVILITYRAASCGESPFLVTLAAGLFILPFLVFSATAGQFADKMDKAWMIRLVKLAEIAIMVLGAVAFIAGSVTGLIAVLFMMGAQSALFGPLKYGILPQVLSREELVGGNALIEMGTFVAILAGTIAGPQLAGIETAWPYWVGAACLLVAVAGYRFSMKIPIAEAVSPGLKINWNIFTETVRNLKFLNENRTVLNSVLGISWFWFFGAIFLVQIPAYSQYVIGGDENLMSTLLALFIMGISTGSLLCERLSGKQVELGLVPFGAFGLTLFGLDLYFASPASPGAAVSALEFLSTGANWRISADLLLIGIFGGFYIVPLYALVQQRSSPDHRSRVIAGLNILNALFMVIAAVMAMLVLGPAGLSIPELFLITAILNAVVAVYIFTLVPEFLMRFLVWMLIHTIYRVRVQGIDNIPEEGPLIVASNHVSFADPLIIGGIIRRPVNFVMYYKIYRIPVLNFIFRTGKAIPIAGRAENPEILDQAYRRIHQVLDCGDVLGIFPEGGISGDGNIQPFKPGVDKIISEKPVNVVPVALCHLWGSLFSRRDPLLKRRPYKLWAKIELRIGTPIPPQEVTAARLQQEVQRLRGDDR